MSNFMTTKFEANYKLKVDHISTQPPNYVANWQCT